MPQERDTQSGVSKEVSEGLLLIGHVIGAFGVGGALRLRLLGAPEKLRGVERLYLGSLGWQRVRRFEVRSVPVIWLSGIASREEAIGLAGCPVFVMQTEYQLESGEYLYTDLIGLAVIDPNGQTLGSVRRIFDTGAQDVLEIERDGKTYLVPLQANYVQVLEENHKPRMIEIDPIPGLFD